MMKIEFFVIFESATKKAMMITKAMMIILMIMKMIKKVKKKKAKITHRLFSLLLKVGYGDSMVQAVCNDDNERFANHVLSLVKKLVFLKI